ncbi:hypothetical protein PGIGA_G00088670 [Pangasianodon gigas]|uniref:Uncharacterized protein n=1 Tax=Pangasianodon gigas TaxID=30993 RepID=A0ACC5XBP5_PANGG|nr:hypothetical protein [Pangasianodon gigas]
MVPRGNEKLRLGAILPASLRALPSPEAGAGSTACAFILRGHYIILPMTSHDSVGQTTHVIQSVVTQRRSQSVVDAASRSLREPWLQTGLSEGTQFSQCLWVSGGEHIVYSEEGDGNLSDFYSSLIHTHTYSSCVRLVNGGSRCAGRVEVLQNGQWGTVCGLGWDMKDAAVVCRELHCGKPVNAPRNAHFGPGSGPIWMVYVECSGSESTLKDCSSDGRADRYGCDHGHDAGVTCSEARLVNGPDSCSGRVELQYLSEWGTVCAVGWDMRAADVLCAQLDCGSAVAVVAVDWFGEGSGQIWADVFDCQGNETHLSQCGNSSWSGAACSHKHDAGVICNGSSVAFHEGRVRLSGGSECQGEVEIYFRQDWRRVLLDSWSLSEASVLCRQLSCGSVLNYRSSPSTTEHKHMCVTGFSCSGSEAHLGNCSSAQPVNCSSREQLYITCSGKQHNTYQ